MHAADVVRTEGQWRSASLGILLHRLLSVWCCLLCCCALPRCCCHRATPAMTTLVPLARLRSRRQRVTAPLASSASPTAAGGECWLKLAACVCLLRASVCCVSARHHATHSHVYHITELIATGCCADSAVVSHDMLCCAVCHLCVAGTATSLHTPTTLTSTHRSTCIRLVGGS